MRAFQIWWLKLCCFLTGYNYYILSNCSEVSIRKAKKYTAALFIVSTLWGFVGYCFCSRYIKLDGIGSAIGALTAIFIVVQVERQILLAEKANKVLKITRFGLAVLMAILGSLIIDQILFKDDIEKNKLQANQDKVNSLMPAKSKQISDYILDIESSLTKEIKKRDDLRNDLNKHPIETVVEVTSSQVPLLKTTMDTSKKSITQAKLTTAVTKTSRVIRNPKFDQLPTMDKYIAELTSQKMIKQNDLLSLRKKLEDEVVHKVGFLDELIVMLDLLKKSTMAIIVYLIWFLFLLTLELLILIGKAYDNVTDYDITIHKQMGIHLRKIELL